MKPFCLFTLIFFIGFSLFSQSLLNNRITEHGIMNYTDRFVPKTKKEVAKDRMDNLKLTSCFSYFPLEKTKLKIDLNKKSTVIGSKGTKVTIHPSSFLYANFSNANGSAEVHLTEALDVFDYMRAGIGHIYYDKYNRTNYMELGGMFKIEVFQGGNRLRLVAEKNIDVEFPNINPLQKFHLFMMNDKGNWVLKSKSSSIPIYSPEGKSSEKEDGYITGVRQVSIDFLGWWSFGMNTTESTAVKGKWEDDKNIAGKKFQIVGVGDDSLYYYMKWFESEEFTLPSPLNTKMNYFLCDDLGNLAIVDSISTTSRTGYDYLPEESDNYLQPLGVFKFQKIPS
ncbi:MAG: hypothetical protein KDK36_11190, partial [Leptospiraceae bacterium]|nr:hypothetical protein [Leptospiraceae bacterium]